MSYNDYVYTKPIEVRGESIAKFLCHRNVGLGDALARTDYELRHQLLLTAVLAILIGIDGRPDRLRIQRPGVRFVKFAPPASLMSLGGL